MKNYETFINEGMKNPFYTPALLIWMDKMFKHSAEKHWYETYHAFDIHGVISRPSYRKHDFVIDYYPYAKETLQYLTKHRPDMILYIMSSSYPEEIAKYMEQFEKDGIHFKYVNENPDISNAKGSFGYYEKKPYFNSYFEDKAGFRPEKDWYYFWKYFTTTKYRPDPNWKMKTEEDYHKS